MKVPITAEAVGLECPRCKERLVAVVRVKRERMKGRKGEAACCGNPRNHTHGPEGVLIFDESVIEKVRNAE